MKKMWTILVPTVRNSGKPFRLRYHRVWDEKVRAYTGGLTILGPAKGQWVCPKGDLYSERMIPVMFVATDEECDAIMKMTLNYYDQLAVLCWEISSNVKFLDRPLAQ
jgi:hypothetical protein